MAHDWGHVFRGATTELLGGWMSPGLPPAASAAQYFSSAPTGNGAAPATPVTGGLGPESCEGMVWSGGVPPKGYKVVNHCGMGVLRKVRRRRRRRMLTASDKADISYIVATAGKGQLGASLIHRSTN